MSLSKILLAGFCVAILSSCASTIDTESSAYKVFEACVKAGYPVETIRVSAPEGTDVACMCDPFPNATPVLLLSDGGSCNIVKK